MENKKKPCRVVVKFKDNNYSNLDADYIAIQGEAVQVWKGENTLVGVFNISDIIGLYMTEKKEDSTKLS